MRVQQNGKHFSSALVAALLLATAGTLAAQDERYNFMPRIDFSKYRTYKWVNIAGAHPIRLWTRKSSRLWSHNWCRKG